MRSLVLTDFHRIDVREDPCPQPGAGEVLLRIAATGICGSDIHGFTGENGRRSPGQVMGHESAGRIEALGPGVDAGALPVGRAATFNPVVVPEDRLEEFAGREQHAPGKTVIGVEPRPPAAFADYVVVPARNVVLLPESMPLHLGTLVEPLAVAVHAVRRAGEAATGRVLVLGGGPIGQSVVTALRMSGAAQVVLSEPDPRRRALCAALGAHVIGPEDGEVAEQAAAGLGGPADLAIDAVGISPTIADALRATRLGGTVVLVGMGSPTLELPAFAVSTEERTLHGSFTYTAQDFADAAAWAGAHPEALEPLVSRLIRPQEAQEAFTKLASGQGDAGKVLVDFSEEVPSSGEHEPRSAREAR